MTPAEYGFAVGQGLQNTYSNVLMGLRENRAQQELSLREKAFQAEQDWNAKRYPLMLRQIETEEKMANFNLMSLQREQELKDAELESSAAMAPILDEMTMLAKADPNRLMTYSVPEISVNSSNPRVAAGASALARRKLQEYQEQLLNNSKEIALQKETANKMRQAATLSDVPSPIRLQLLQAAKKVESGGVSNLNDFELQSLVPFADKVTYQRSPAYFDSLEKISNIQAKQEDSRSKRTKALGDIAGNIFVSPELKQYAEKELMEAEPKTEASAKTKAMPQAAASATPEELNVFKADFRKAASAIQQNANALDVVDNLSENMLKTYKIPNTPQNKMAAQKKILELLKQSGVSLPFGPEDLSSPLQTEESP